MVTLGFMIKDIFHIMWTLLFLFTHSLFLIRPYRDIIPFFLIWWFLSFLVKRGIFITLCFSCPYCQIVLVDIGRDVGVTRYFLLSPQHTNLTILVKVWMSQSCIKIQSIRDLPNELIDLSIKLEVEMFQYWVQIPIPVCY